MPSIKRPVCPLIATDARTSSIGGFGPKPDFVRNGLVAEAKTF
jgi:hypothetical protein